MATSFCSTPFCHGKRGGGKPGTAADGDLLRDARRLIERAPALVAGFDDFFTLGGVHDLLVHRHEDPFDVPRIGRALDALGLELLAFRLADDADRDRYRREHPDDPLLRNLGHWAALERTNPSCSSACTASGAARLRPEPCPGRLRSLAVQT